MKGFSGYLPAEQVLQLWDLLLAYNSVQIFSLFAMGVLSIRKDNLMKAQQPHIVDVSFLDLCMSTILVLGSKIFRKKLLPCLTFLFTFRNLLLKFTKAIQKSGKIAIN
jgi:hypothetical protein